MKNIIKTTLLGVMLFVSFANAQDEKTRRADRNFEDYAFINAIDSYETLIKKGYSKADIYKKLGDANYYNARYDEAADWYGRLMDLKTETLEVEYQYRYAQTLRSLGEYEASNDQMQQLAILAPNDNRSALFSKSTDYLEEIEKNSGRYDVQSLSINSKESDFSSAFFKDQLVFATARDTGIIAKKIHQWNAGSFLNLYKAEMSEDGTMSGTSKFSSTLNTKAHESSAVFTKDGKTIYFTRNNFQDNKFKRDDDGISRLKIYKAEFDGETWKNARALPFNSSSYSVAHPALSSDEKTLYFSSDMEGSLGLSDIFKVTINKDGSYGVPENLGSTINTESRETFPFVSEDVLYFASDGHPGLGGLDVFATKLDGSNTKVANLGSPVNGKQDDFAYVINDMKKGFFTSNREGGMGNDDIYSFVESKALNFDCTSELMVKVVSMETKEVIANAKVSILDETGMEVNKAETSREGLTGTEIDCNQEKYQIMVSKDGFEPKSIVYSLIEETEDGVTVALEETLKAPITIGDDLINYLALKPILFDLDSAMIREDAALVLNDLAKYLKNNPNVGIEIQSHTDAKASRAYNQRLSEKRAKSTFEYLRKRGVTNTNITFKGYGEDQLLNDCEVWSNCSDEENEQNRRSEFLVTSID